MTDNPAVLPVDADVQAFAAHTEIAPASLTEEQFEALPLEERFKRSGEHPLATAEVFIKEDVTREIQFYIERAAGAVFEAGRRILWAKSILPHGVFMSWVETDLKMGERNARHYMGIARMMLKNPDLQKPWGRLGVKKLRLLTQVPSEDLQAAQEGGDLYGLPMEELDGVPYAQLKKQVDKAARRADAAEKRADAAQKDADKARRDKEETLLAIGIMGAGTRAEVFGTLERLRDDLEGALALFAAFLEKATFYKELSAADAALLARDGAWLERCGKAVNLRVLSLLGDDVRGEEWQDVLLETVARPIPEWLKPPFFDDPDDPQPDDGKPGRGRGRK